MIAPFNLAPARAAALPLIATLAVGSALLGCDSPNASPAPPYTDPAALLGPDPAAETSAIAAERAAAAEAPAAEAALAPADADTRYDEVRQKSVHNSFQRKEALIDQMVYHRLRSIELDIHVGKSGWSRVPGDWYVYHTDIFDAATTCHRLSDCLDELRAFHLMNPAHEVITVWLDLKDGWQSGNDPDQLDNRISAHLDPAWLMTPAELLDRCPGASDLQAAVTGGCSWPTLDSLRGRFLIALTGGDVSSPSTKLSQYLDAGGADQRLGFVAPDLVQTSDIDRDDDVVFFNLKRDDVALAAEVQGRYVSRVWGVNDAGAWGEAEAYGAHHIATDKVNIHRDTWARTHNSHGYPFECFAGCSAGLTESSQVLGVEVNSEDIWGSGDDFRFRYGYTTSVGNLWTASISTPNSHVDEWAKGCLMARESTSDRSRYFAVCRPADENRLRIQWRSSHGGSTSKKDVAIVPDDTIDQESLTHVRLYVYSDNRCAAGYGSQDGQSWALIGYQCFDVPLQRQGVAASSHGSTPVKFLFTNLAINGAPLATGDLPSAASIGTVRSAREFDGVF
ncbi:MAG: hypothetical protein Tsb0020_43500 [Haliangiales bacterium]